MKDEYMKLSHIVSHLMSKEKGQSHMIQINIQAEKRSARMLVRKMTGRCESPSLQNENIREKL